MAEFIRAARVNHCFLTPTLIDAMLAELSPERMQGLMGGLNAVWVGGEVLSAATLRRFSARLPGTAVINNYGPSECFVVSQGRVDDMDLPADGICPAGKVLDGIDALILDESGAQCAVDVPGALCVGGTCLVDGYFDAVGSADDFFVRDGRRWFRTFDAARIDAEGQLWLLGRIARSSPVHAVFEKERTVVARLRRFADVAGVVHLRAGAADGAVHLFFVVLRDPEGARPILRGQGPHALGLSDGARAQLYSVPHIPLSPISKKADHRALLGMRDSAERLL